MGSWDFPSLPTNTVPARGNTSGPAGRWQHHWKACKEQTAPPVSWKWRETGPRTQGCQIRGVLCSDTGRGGGVELFHAWKHLRLYPDLSVSLSLFSISEVLKMCSTRPFWLLWSPLRPKPGKSAFCYRLTPRARVDGLEMGRVIKKSWINDHGEKHGDRRHSANETYSDSRVHWLCLQNKLGKRLRNQTSACSKAVCVTGLFFRKLLKPFSWRIQVGQAPPACRYHSI